MDTHDTRRRLVRHGMALFLLGLVVGVVVPAFTNPRMGLSAHLGALMTGTFLLALGAVWDEVRLGARAAMWAAGLTLYGSWASAIALVLAAVFGTASMTPIASVGHAAVAWQEAVVTFGLVTGSPALLLGCGLFLAGLRGRALAQPGARMA